MTDAELEQYRKGRYSELLEFYDRKAGRNKSIFYLGSAYVVLASAALVPLTTLGSSGGRALTIVIAPTVAAVAGLLSLFQAQQNWRSYRAAWDALKREDSLWRARLDEYGVSSDPHATFVARVEAVASSEGKDWYVRQGEGSGPKPAPSHTEGESMRAAG